MICTLNIKYNLRFYGTIRYNNQDIAVYAKCKDVSHKMFYRFLVDNDFKNLLSISIQVAL